MEGLTRFIEQSPRDQLQLTVVRVLQDDPYVFTQATGKRSGKNIFFDVFRSEEDLVVEHWAFSTEEAPANRSGHTQLDGPTEPRHPEDTEKISHCCAPNTKRFTFAAITARMNDTLRET